MRTIFEAIVIAILAGLTGCADTGGNPAEPEPVPVADPESTVVSVYVDCRAPVDEMLVMIEVWDSAGWLYISELWPRDDTAWVDTFIAPIRGRCAWSGHVAGRFCWDDCPLELPADTVVIDTVANCAQTAGHVRVTFRGVQGKAGAELYKCNALQRYMSPPSSRRSGEPYCGLETVVVKNHSSSSQRSLRPVLQSRRKCTVVDFPGRSRTFTMALLS